MTSIKIYDISGQQLAHAGRKGLFFGFAQQMKMIRHQRPSIYIHATVLRNAGYALDKVIAICVIKKNFSFFNASTDYMMHNARSI